MKLPTNGAAREIRHFSGSLFIFLFIIGIIVTFVQYPVLESNKEIVLMLIGSIAASIPVLISTISGTRADDVTPLKNKLESKEQQIESLIVAKDEYESMIIKLQKDMLKNQDDMFDKFILKAAMDFDDKRAINIKK